MSRSNEPRLSTSILSPGVNARRTPTCAANSSASPPIPKRRVCRFQDLRERAFQAERGRFHGRRGGML
ncbi:hypothetical protein DACRYDRAFT_23863, partial [Dacryopinax primogenitus]